MSIDSKIKELVRQRADFKCEFCGVSEVDTAGKLTIDHYLPISKSGTDDFSNLVYCCVKCNNFKYNYSPVLATDIPLFNPRTEEYKNHFISLQSGILQVITSIGRFTINRLKLNRKLLIQYRLKQQKYKQNINIGKELQELITLQAELQKKLTEFYTINQKLNDRQRNFLEQLLKLLK